MFTKQPGHPLVLCHRTDTGDTRPWSGNPRPALEPFRELLLSDRHPTKPPQQYTAEQSRILCPIFLVPEISRRAHKTASPTVPSFCCRYWRRHPTTTTTTGSNNSQGHRATVALLLSARPDHLSEGALSVPVEDLLDFED
ncbi:hypothetical protein MRX96_057360 [Rhipicephalus microplus]